ncbi:hypothetical protein PG988_001989 [Apiospora saccharicola]
MASSRAIETLQLSFPSGRVALPATEAYNDRNSSYASKLESDISPHAIFLPETTAESKRETSSFAIRGAGCQPLPGCADIQGGITLDLSRLVGTTLDETQGVVRIPAGERWAAVYKTVQEKGLAVTGARSDNNGIGGLALSGGLSFSGTREGFISDNVVNYEVVLASGEVVNANRQENADLFIALRGGGNNLGIPALEKVKSIDGMVFSFTMQPYPVSLLKRTEPAGGNVLGLDPAGGPLVSILILLYWNKQSDDETVLGTARGVIEAIDQDATTKGALVPYKYLNYAFDFQDLIGSYGQENRKKLQDASRKYDPDGLFQKGVPGGFKLFP